jgi:predicted Zn finger-like uncharacterized protein
MNGTTLCPHCETRFKIAQAQLTAHRGMVRCGHCLQAFDARPSFVPEQPHPQLDLPMDETLVHVDEPIDPTPHELRSLETHVVALAHAGEDIADIPEPTSAKFDDARDVIADPSLYDSRLPDRSESDDTLDFSHVADAYPAAEHSGFTKAIHAEEQYYAEHPTPTEQAREAQDEVNNTIPARHRTWLWIAGTFIVATLLMAQSAYFFRISLAAHLPAIKPALVEYCHLLGCSVPLPKKAALISIESSSLDADPEHENQITLNALLRNRASYTLALPALALTLNDSQDNPLARRLFLPNEYLPADENEKTGFPGNHEINIKLPLHTGDLKPVGYRLEFFYQQP